MAKGSTWRPIAIACSVLLCIFLMACCGGGSIIWTRYKNGPSLHDSTAPSVVADQKGGWKTYRFDDLGLTIDLPSEPTRQKMAVESLVALRVDTYSRWVSTDKHLSVLLFGQWYRFLTPRPGRTAGLVRRAWQRRLGVTDLKVEQSNATVDGQSVWTQTARYRLNGEPAEWRGIYLSRTDMTLEVQVTDNAPTAESQKESEKILKSVKLKNVPAS